MARGYAVGPEKTHPDEPDGQRRGGCRAASPAAPASAASWTSTRPRACSTRSARARRRRRSRSRTCSRPRCCRCSSPPSGSPSARCRATRPRCTRAPWRSRARVAAAAARRGGGAGAGGARADARLDPRWRRPQRSCGPPRHALHAQEHVLRGGWRWRPPRLQARPPRGTVYVYGVCVHTATSVSSSSANNSGVKRVLLSSGQTSRRLPPAWPGPTRTNTPLTCRRVRHHGHPRPARS